MAVVNPQYHNLLTLYLDDGPWRLSDGTFDYQSNSWEGRVLRWGAIDRSIATPPGGLFQTGAVSFELADTDDDVRDRFDTRTPFRRQGDVRIGLDTSLSTPAPVYVGEISDPSFGGYSGTFELRDSVSAWMDRKIPGLVNRTTFPNLPDHVDEVFARYIFGRVESPTITNVAKQGRIECPLVDTENQRFLVARHTCHSIIQAYIKKPIDDYFTPLSSGAYTVVELPVTIDGVTYVFTLIETNVYYPDGTRIRVDVSGLNYRREFGSMIAATPGELLNPIDALISLCLDAESRTSRYHTDKFSTSHAVCADRNYKIGGCIDQETTYGDAIGQMCSDFGIDFYTTGSGGLIAAHIDDPDLDDAPVELNDMFTLRESVQPSLPPFSSEVKLRFRYRYARNYGLSGPSGELTMDGRQKIGDGQWGFEHTLVNAADLLELQVGMMSVFAADASSDTCTLATGTLDDGTPVRLRNLSGALPGGLDDATLYFVVNSDGADFQLALTPGGSAVDISSAGAGTQYVGNPDNSIQEDLVEMNFVSDEDVALDLMKERAGWHSLRSYHTTFELYGPANTPAFMNSIDLTRRVSLTHGQGIQAGGWSDMEFKATGIRLDLTTHAMEVRAIRHIPQDQMTFEASWTGTHPAHAAQVRTPDILVAINAGAATAKRVNLNDTTPAAPEGYGNVAFQELEVDGVRQVSAYIPDFSLGDIFWEAFADGIINTDGPVYVQDGLGVDGGFFAQDANPAGALYNFWSTDDDSFAALQLISANGRTNGIASYTWDDPDFLHRWSIGGDEPGIPLSIWVDETPVEAMRFHEGGDVSIFQSLAVGTELVVVGDASVGNDLGVAGEIYSNTLRSYEPVTGVGAAIGLGDGDATFGVGFYDETSANIGGFTSTDETESSGAFWTNLFLIWTDIGGAADLRQCFTARLAITIESVPYFLDVVSTNLEIAGG